MSTENVLSQKQANEDGPRTGDIIAGVNKSSKDGLLKKTLCRPVLVLPLFTQPPPEGKLKMVYITIERLAGLDLIKGAVTFVTALICKLPETLERVCL